MEVLNINIFLSYKTNELVQNLDSNTLILFNEIFESNDKNRRWKKNIKKSSNNILKNQKIQNKKENIINKVNFILNKLSESNLDSLVIEFLENINQIDIENFEEIQKTFYLKIIFEINFIKIYLQFLKVLGAIYNKVQQYDLSFFISIVEHKFKLDYTNDNLTRTNKYKFIEDLDEESKRINNLILIKNLVEYKLMSENLLEECDNIIINQNKYLPDVYYWFNSKNRNLTQEETNKIKLYLTKDGINPRETILLENLLNKTVVNQSVAQNINVLKKNNVEKVVIKTDTLKIECNNIIEEYLLIKSLEDVEYFINNRCKDAITKNKYCEYLFDKYFLSNKNEAKEIIELMKELVRSQVLFKSNLSRGLLFIYHNWKERTIDYNRANEKMKYLLVIFKQIKITRGLEQLMELYGIEQD